MLTKIRYLVDPAIVLILTTYSIIHICAINSEVLRWASPISWPSIRWGWHHSQFKANKYWFHKFWSRWCKRLDWNLKEMGQRCLCVCLVCVCVVCLIPLTQTLKVWNHTQIWEYINIECINETFSHSYLNRISICPNMH